MDIEILLWFQSFRELTDAWLSSFFTLITNIAVTYYILIPLLILFWSIDKKKASRMILTWGMSLSIGAFLKCIFCIYRPWVRDARINPPDSIKSGATGYSFPSGHSFSAGGFWNGLLVTYKKYKGIVIFSILMVLTTMVSRLYFTVHTPQDVLVGVAISIFSAIAIAKLYPWIEEKENRDFIVLIVVTILMIALLCYTYFKSYPMDYDANGVLLVDPKKLTVDCFKDEGRFYGIVLGWFIERRFIKFNTNGTTYQKVMRSLIGGMLVLIWWNCVANPIGSLVGVGIIHFIMQAATPLIFMTIYPLVFTSIEAKNTNKN